MTKHDHSRGLARSYLEDVWNRGDLTAVDAIVAEEIEGHVNGSTFHGRETLKDRVSALRRSYTDPRFSVEDILVDTNGDRVCARWTFRGVQTGRFMGRPPTGKTVEVTGMNVFRIADGRIRELWVNADDLGELTQLGIVGALSEASS